MTAKNSPAEKPVITWTMVLIAAAACSVLLASLFMSPPQRRGFTSHLIGQPMPKLEVEGWLNGPGPTAEELAGKVIVLDAWAYWCVPCRRGAPHLLALYEKYRTQGVVFLGLTAEGEPALAESRQFVEDTKLPWPQGYGAIKPLQFLEANYIPQFWVIDRSGRIAWVGMGNDPLEEGIEHALHPPADVEKKTAAAGGSS